MKSKPCDKELAEAMTRDCASCGKRTAAKAARCAHCGFVKAAANRAMHVPVTCPTCAIATEIVTLAGIELDRCGRCYGLWFDRTELQMLAAALSDEQLADELQDLLKSLGATAMSTPAAYPKCPVCTHLMQRRIYASVSGVMVKRCEPHGTWVERDAAIRLIGLMRGDGDAELRALEAQKKSEAAARQVSELRAATAERIALDRHFNGDNRIFFVLDIFDFF